MWGVWENKCDYTWRVICTDPLYNQLLFSSFQKIVIVLKKKKIIELFTELLSLPGMHPVYSCTEDYLAEAEEILKACALLCIFMYLSCGVYCVTLSGGGLFVPLQDVLSLASTFFFLSLFFFFSQLINKLTDLPYPNSHCPPKVLVQQNTTRRSNAANITLSENEICPF